MYLIVFVSVESYFNLTAGLNDRRQQKAATK